ncbi:glycosyltransferase [Mesorhizobium sp. CU2]|uniref:glycosyltransferase n=1 Tax=unclassified Mesorhizobium TaxID=325217 RepID=UPI001126D3D9|nr:MULTISPECIES: glycosyltransferase [unclassified Mesorhizobium]TPN81831.1 glycosyltransferase [Mesorhizobium sp. CU3]TPO07106.1 glycosyltransferase [Mesorhizobium sp. CU2]
MPMKNGEDYVADALQSMMNQDLADIEIIVVDDGSSDGSVAIARRIGEHDGRLKIVTNPGSGIVDALNAGISLAEAPLLARMDCDDVSMPNRLRLQVERFSTNQELLLLGSAGTSIDSNDRETGTIEVPLEGGQIRDALLKHNPMLHPTTMFRAAPARRVGGYRRAFTYAEDYDLWTRLSEIGQLANMAEKLVRLRTHSAQTSKTKRNRQKAAAALVRQAAALRRLRSEPFDADGPAEDAIKSFLLWRAGQGHGIDGDECRDIELLLRTPGISAALTRRVLSLGMTGAPPLKTFALGSRLAWHRLATKLSDRRVDRAGRK